MDPILFVSFILATLVIVITPGPGVALASSQAVKLGKHAAVLTVLGDALGTVVLILIALAGLNVIIGVAKVVLPYLQIAGGLFILYLAYQSFFAKPDSDEAQVLTAGRSAFLSGFFACVTNPKAIVFFMALFPGFIAPDLNIAFQSVVYGAIFILLDGAFLIGYAMLALYVVWSRFSLRINIDKLGGMGLFGVGALLVAKGYQELPSG